MQINGTELTAAEVSTYSRAAGKARLAYVRKHGGSAVPVPAGHRVQTGGSWGWRDDAARLEVAGELAARADVWQAVHGEAYAAAAHRAGVSAVKRMLKGYAEDPRFAVEYAARLEVLGMAEGRRKPAAAPAVEVPAAVESPAAELRKGSKLEPCDRHASYWGSLAPRDRFRNAVEGGVTPGTCTGATPCMLTPGTDRYAADFVAAGPTAIGSLEVVPAVVHAAAEVGRGAGVTSGPVCSLADDLVSLEGVAVVEGVTCDACRRVLERLESAAADVAPVVPIRPELEPMADVDEPAAPETVPEPMPGMTRAARRASNRELAARMRAAGLTPAGEPWRLAVAGVPLEDIARKLAELEPAGL